MKHIISNRNLQIWYLIGSEHSTTITETSEIGGNEKNA